MYVCVFMTCSTSCCLVTVSGIYGMYVRMKLVIKRRCHRNLNGWQGKNGNIHKHLWRCHCQKKHSRVLGETRKMAKTKEHQGQGCVESSMADHKCSHIFFSTFKYASTNSSISINILQMLVNIPNVHPPLPLNSLWHILFITIFTVRCHFDNWLHPWHLVENFGSLLSQMVKKYCMLSADKGDRLLGFVYEGCHYLLTFQKHTTACRQTGILLSIGGKVKIYWKPNFTSFQQFSTKKRQFFEWPSLQKHRCPCI